MRAQTAGSWHSRLGQVYYAHSDSLQFSTSCAIPNAYDPVWLPYLGGQCLGFLWPVLSTTHSSIAQLPFSCRLCAYTARCYAVLGLFVSTILAAAVLLVSPTLDRRCLY